VNRSKLTDRRVSMDDVESLTHTLWECKYPLVWIPKYRKKLIRGKPVSILAERIEYLDEP